MLRFIEGFDHYNTIADANKKWTALPAGSFGTGRTGSGNCMVFTGTSGSDYCKKTLDNQQYWYIGFAVMRTSSASTGMLVALNDVNSTQVFLQWQSISNKLYFTSTSTSANIIYNNGTEAALALNTWYYVEIKVKIELSTAAGDCQIYVNGSLYSSCPAGCDFRNGDANNYANTIFFGNPSTDSYTGNYSFDDIYICDGQGTTNNGILGPCYVTTLMPAGAGSSTQWTPNTAVGNYAEVNEIPENGDTTYVSTSTVGNRDSYTIASLPDIPIKIFGVQQTSLARIDASETGRTIDNSIKSGSSFTDSAASPALTSTYAWFSTIQATDPNTSTAWAVAGVNAMEAGVKLVS